MRGTVLACAEQHLGDVPAIYRSTQEIPRSRRRKNITWRAERRPLVVEIDRTPRMGGSPLGQSVPWRSPISSEAREGPRGPRHAEEGLPRRSQTNRRWSLRVTCSWPLPPWAAEVGPAQHQFSEWGVPHYRHARPGGTTDGDGTDDGKRLAPPFRGNTDMGKRESRIIAGTCRGKRE